MQKNDLAVVILAAGKGKRMKLNRPKVLQFLDGKPLINRVVKTAKSLHPSRVVVIVGFGAAEVKKTLAFEDVSFAVQEEQLGTGHAVMQAGEALAGFDGGVMVLSGDVPLIRTETLKGLMDLVREKGIRVAFLSAEMEEPGGYGRVIRSENGSILEIVEERDATAEQKAVKEINGGIYLFDKKLLFELLPGIRCENDQKEYYLTDAVKAALDGGEEVQAFGLSDPMELQGVNSPEQLELLRNAVARK